MGKMKRKSDYSPKCNRLFSWRKKKKDWSKVKYCSELAEEAQKRNRSQTNWGINFATQAINLQRLVI